MARRVRKKVLLKSNLPFFHKFAISFVVSTLGGHFRIAFLDVKESESHCNFKLDSLNC